MEMTAPKNYEPVDLVYEEEPFAHVLGRSLKDILCETCHERPSVLKTCQQCREVKYCNRDCQKTDWKDHKYECKLLKNLPKNPLHDFVRLLGKVILKIKGREWNTIEKRILQSITSFDDLDSHSNYMRDKLIAKLFCKEVNGLTRKYIGDKNMPDEDDFIEILGKVKFNTFLDSSDSSLPYKGYFFFIAASKLDYECIPNCNIDIAENRLRVWAVKKMKKGTKITVSYRKIFSSKTLLMDETFIKDCKSKECKLHFGESILTRIIDGNRAYSVISETQRVLDLWKAVDSCHGDPSYLEPIVDRVLRKQEDVLAPTHVLRLKSLALKCLHIGRRNPEEMKAILEELESSIKSVYGAFYSEMMTVCEDLKHSHDLFENCIEKFEYIQKLMPFGVFPFLQTTFPESHVN